MSSGRAAAGDRPLSHARRGENSYRLTYVTAIAGCAVILSAVSASADHTQFFSRAWANDVVIRYTIDPDMPSTAWLSRIGDAVGEWNAAEQDQEPVFLYVGQLDVPSITQVCSVTVNLGIRREQLDDLPQGGTSVGGQTRACVNAGTSRIVRSIVALDVGAGSATSYYTGTAPDISDNGTSNELDLWSITSHEIGHSLGWVPHWDEGVANPVNSICPDSNVRRTMCAGVLRERVAQRTIGASEEAELQAEYPHP